MFQCPQQCPGCPGEFCTSHKTGRVGEGAVWYVVLLSSRHHCLQMPHPTGLWGQLCASPSAGDPICHCQLTAVEGEGKEYKVGPARRKRWDDSTHKAWHLQGRDG